MDENRKRNGEKMRKKMHEKYIKMIEEKKGFLVRGFYNFCSKVHDGEREREDETFWSVVDFYCCSSCSCSGSLQLDFFSCFLSQLLLLFFLVM